jgi:hypothetical protein
VPCLRIPIYRVGHLLDGKPVPRYQMQPVAVTVPRPLQHRAGRYRPCRPVPAHRPWPGEARTRRRCRSSTRLRRTVPAGPTGPARAPPEAGSTPRPQRLPAGVGQRDQRPASVVGVRLSAHQPALLHSPDLVGESAARPEQAGREVGCPPRRARALRQRGEHVVVRLRQSGVVGHVPTHLQVEQGAQPSVPAPCALLVRGEPAS